MSSLRIVDLASQSQPLESDMVLEHGQTTGHTLTLVPEGLSDSFLRNREVNPSISVSSGEGEMRAAGKIASFINN